MTSIIYFLKQIHHYSGKIVYLNLVSMAGIGLLDGLAIILLVPLISMSGVLDMGGEKVPLLKIFNIFSERSIAVGISIILLLYLIIVVGLYIFNFFISNNINIFLICFLSD